jgi:hypothetical protein
MQVVKRRRITPLEYYSNMNQENENISIFDSIENKSFEYQLIFYKNKLCFLELKECREMYSKEYIQQEKKITTEKFRTLLKIKEKNSSLNSINSKKDHIVIDIF